MQVSHLTIDAVTVGRHERSARNHLWLWLVQVDNPLLDADAQGIDQTTADEEEGV